MGATGPIGLLGRQFGHGVLARRASLNLAP